MDISRRDFLKYAGGGIAGGIAVLVVGSKLSWLADKPTYAATSTISLRIGDAIKQMHTHNTDNAAECYFWMYKSVSPDLPHDCPGPVIIATKGDTVNISVENGLDEPHAFFIPGIFDSGPIAPGAIFVGVINLANAPAGSHLYFDNLNEPVNRVMGLHGALIVMPAAASGARWTPYDTATPAVQQLFDDFGPSEHFPGLAWEEGDSTPWALNAAFPGSAQGTLTQPNCPPFRQYVWLAHQASPKLFAEVGNFTPGQDYPAQEFLDKFLRDPLPLQRDAGGDPIPVNNSAVGTNSSYTARYFTFSGQSGFFAHDSPVITPMGRVGEPCVVHILNAGLWSHSMHLHANHFYVTSVNGVVRANVFSLDTFEVGPMDRVDYIMPYTRPPDVPNERGIGMAVPGQDDPLVSPASGQPVWPPVQEFNMYMPGITPGVAPHLTIPADVFYNGSQVTGKDRLDNDIDLEQRISPLCYPMHDHSEPTQTTQGGNYNTGIIGGIYFVGDRNGLMDFPMDEDFHLMFRNVRGVTVPANTLPATLPAAPPHHPE